MCSIRTVLCQNYSPLSLFWKMTLKFTNIDLLTLKKTKFRKNSKQVLMCSIGTALPKPIWSWIKSLNPVTIGQKMQHHLSSPASLNTNLKSSWTKKANHLLSQKSLWWDRYWGNQIIRENKFARRWCSAYRPRHHWHLDRNTQTFLQPTSKKFVSTPSPPH